MWNPEEVLLKNEDVKAPAEFLADTFDWQVWSDAISRVTEADKEWLDELRKIEGLGYLHKELSRQEHEELREFYQNLREKMKESNINFVLPGGHYDLIDRELSDMVIGIGHCEIESDLSRLEERFAADAQKWDDRLFGADEEFVEVCSDPEVLAAARQITQEREKQKKDLIVLGAGPRAVGTLTGAILASIQRKHGGTYFDMETFGVDTIKTDKPHNFDYNQGKLRKGKGHHKFKKGKKK